MRINNNLMAMNTHRQLGTANAAGAKSMEKLSSGMRINRAGDDAAGLAISEKMRGQIRGLNQASSNAQDGISLIQTAEGALNETHAILQRMRELAVQSSTDTNVGVDRSEIQKEMNELIDEIDRIADQTQFNEQNLLDGSFSEKKFHIGANEGQNVELSVNAMGSGAAGGGSATGVVTKGTGDVNSVTISGSAAGVADGNTVTIKTTEVAGGPISATLTGGSAAQPTTNLSGIESSAKLTITIDSTGYDISDSDLKSATGTGKTIDNLVGAINTAIGTSGTASVGTGVDAGKIVIKSDATGDAASVTIGITGTGNSGADATNIATAFGLANGASASGSDTGPSTYSIEFSGTTGTTATVTGLAADATTVTGTGDFAGFEVTLDGTLGNNVTSTIAVSVSGGGAGGLGLTDLKVADVTKDTTSGGIMTQSEASKAITTIQTAIESVSAERSKLGAMQNRLEHTIKNLDTSSENLQASEARIRDVDMAKEMMEQTKQNILSQASTAMLAQANQAPQGVLQLLR